MKLERKTANIGAILAICIAAASHAHADVVISSGVTSNMTCSGGVCAPTATNAVLNVHDLERLLASGNAEVTTTGTGVQADNIDVNGRVSWSSTYPLVMDAYESITVAQSVYVNGLSSLTLTTNDGGKSGTISFGSKGNISFANLSSSLIIDGAAYVVAGDLSTLADDIAANTQGNFALANDYDASHDGTYSAAPLGYFYGRFSGLGHTISHLTVISTRDAGLFGAAYYDVCCITVSKSHMKASGQYAYAGEIAGESGTTIHNVRFQGKIDCDNCPAAGGIIGESGNSISDAQADVILTGSAYAAGGLVGWVDQGSISNSWSVGSVSGDATGGLIGIMGGAQVNECFSEASVVGRKYGPFGGLVGLQGGQVTNSYARGAVTGDYTGYGIGGFMGTLVGSAVATSYSTGMVSIKKVSDVGGFAGQISNGTASNSYWDTKTSGTKTGVGYGDSTGIAGLTTRQFRSGLPSGFDPAIWAEKKGVNDGLPYLIANPPLK